MSSIIRYIIVLYLTFCGALLYAQDLQNSFNREKAFTVRGSVMEQDTRKPIKNVNIEVNGGGYTTTDIFGEFRIEARRGDELTIRHKDFETIYYTIQSNERIEVKVEPSDEENLKYDTFRSVSKRQTAFKPLIDSAEVYLKTDAKKSIQFIAEALAESNSVKENSEAYEVLGDIYTFWKQCLGDVYLLTKSYNLSIGAYQDGLKVALKHLITPKITDLNSKIAQAYNANGEPQKASEFFNTSMKLANNENKKRAVQEKIKVADFKSESQNFDDEIELRKEALNTINELESDADKIDNESALTPQKQNYKNVELVDKLYILKEQEIAQATRFSRDIVSKQNRILSLESDRELSESIGYYRVFNV